jgi:heme-degrading monooxygenase HmoA
MFIAVTRVKLPKEHLERMAEGFRRAAPDMRQFSGFLGLELWRSEDTLEAISRWESRQAMEVYSNSDLFRSHHGRPTSGRPAGGGETTGQQGPGAGQVAYYEGEVVV